MNTQNNLTIIILVHRLDDRLKKAIESSAWAQEVVLIQTQTHTNLADFVKQYHVTVVQFDHLTSFASVRNQAMEIVSTKWIFFLDSDEWISKELQQEIEHNIADTTSEAFLIPRTDFVLNKPLFHGEVKGVKIIRLLKKGSGSWHGNAHEVFQLHSPNRVPIFKNALFHTPHASIHEFIQKINTYTSLLAEEKSEKKMIARSIFFPICKFIYTFVAKQGFLDGYRGLVYSFMMSIHSAAVRIKRYEIYKS